MYRTDVTQTGLTFFFNKSQVFSLTSSATFTLSLVGNSCIVMKSLGVIYNPQTFPHQAESDSSHKCDACVTHHPFPGFKWLLFMAALGRAFETLARHVHSRKYRLQRIQPLNWDTSKTNKSELEANEGEEGGEALKVFCVLFISWILISVHKKGNS